MTSSGATRLERLLAPRSIAVVGATERPGYAARLLANVVAGGYEGPVYPISTSRKTVSGLAAYASLGEAPRPIDVAVIVVPADGVPDVVEACGECGVAAAVVISSGFGEAGAEGRRRRDLLRAAAASSGVLVIGPNSNGYASVAASLWATTFSGLKPHEAKPAIPAVLLSQSGGSAFGAAHEKAQDHGYSFEAVISTGNEEVVASEHLAEELLQGHTRVLAMVCEDFHDGPALLRAAGAARERGRYLVVLKVGRSAAGRAAAATHTAALAADDSVIDGVLRQHGVVRVEDIDELVQCVRYLSSMPPPRGRCAIVLTHSGGLGALAADALGTAGFELPALSEAARAGLDAALGEVGGRGNPTDVTMALREPVVTEVVRILADEHPDVLQVVTAGDLALAERVAAGVRTEVGGQVPTCLVWSGGVRTAAGLKPLEDGVVPWFTGARISAAVLGRCRDAAAQESPSAPPQKAAEVLPAATVDEGAAKALLSAAGLAVPESVMADTADAIVQASHAVPGPWALKAVAPEVIHKAQAGLLALGLDSIDALRRTAEQLTTLLEASPATHGRLLLERQVDAQAEVYVGCTVDPHFGRVIGIGRGGSDVEFAGRVVWATCPLSTSGARALVHDRDLLAWLTARGVADSSLEQFAHWLAQLSEWFAGSELEPQLVELNPVALERHTGSAIVLDAVISLPTPATPATRERGGEGERDE